MLLRPLCGNTVERAFGVVLLVGDHSAYADDQVVQAFRSRIVVLSADIGVVEVRMEERREELALRLTAGVLKAELDFHDVFVAFEEIAVRGRVQPFDSVMDSIRVGRLTADRLNANHLPAAES